MDPVNQEGQHQETPVVEPVTAQASAPAPVTAPEVHSAYDAKDVADNKFVAALSYVGILFLVPLLVKKDSPFAQFHAKQGLVLCIAFFVGSFIFWFPIIGWAAAIFLLVVDIMALVKTLSGEAWSIPGVKDVVKKLNI